MIQDAVSWVHKVTVNFIKKVQSPEFYVNKSPKLGWGSSSDTTGSTTDASPEAWWSGREVVRFEYVMVVSA